MSKLYHILLKNGSFLDKHFLFFLCLCILTERIYENFIKTALYGGKIMGYNIKSRRAAGGRRLADKGAVRQKLAFPAKII